MSTIKPLNFYRTVIFDCDGVLLNSNKIKTDAFREVAKQYGHDIAEAFVAHHNQNGGVSRFKKFKYLLSNLVGEDPSKPEIARLCNEYSTLIVNKLISCEKAVDLTLLRNATKSAGWMVVSGGDQTELRDIFIARNLEPLFNLNIFGSPDSKDVILAREIKKGSIVLPALFLGDSRYDFMAASTAGLDFIFVHGWTEFEGWKEFCILNGIETIKQTSDLLPI